MKQRQKRNTIGSSRWRHSLGAPGVQMRGFTLIELMVTASILVILTLVAAPSFNDAFLSNKLASYANNFVASAHLARSEAIKRNATVTLCRSADAATCATTGGWQQGWIVKSGTTVVQQQAALSSDYLFTGNVYSVAFQASGAGANSATLKLCRATPSPGSQDREIKIDATGRTSVKKTATGTCG